MKKISFSYNWNNKLNCNCFTTFRVKSEKYNVGETYEIYLNNVFVSNAKIIDIKTLKLKDVNEWIARLDTGYSQFEFDKLIRTMYKNKFQNIDEIDFVLLLLEKIN